MRNVLTLFVLLAVTPICSAADIEAARTTVTTVCAACHGVNGVSVSDTIPNLAAQRIGYLEAQLKALKEGTRKNAVMNAIAAQLSAEDMSNVATYFAAQPGVSAGAKSNFLPNVAASHVAFPEDYRTTFVKYQTINVPTSGQVRHYFANKAAAQAARDGQPLPEGSVLLIESYAAKLDADKKPVPGRDGGFAADKLLFYSVSARGAGWGKDIPAMLRNGDWNYAQFTPDRQQRPGVNHAECLACHKPREDASYTFTLKAIAETK